MSVNLGDLVRDVLTGFEGRAESRTRFLTGCARIWVQPKAFEKDGEMKLPEGKFFDEPILTILEAFAEPLPTAGTGVG